MFSSVTLLFQINYFLGGAISCQDHSRLSLIITNLTENKAQSFYTMNGSDCPPG